MAATAVTPPARTSRKSNFLQSFALSRQHSMRKIPCMMRQKRVSLTQIIQQDLLEDDFLLDDETSGIFQNYISTDPNSCERKVASKLKTGIATGLFLDDSVKQLNVNQGYNDNLSVNCLRMKYPKPDDTMKGEEEPDCSIADAARFQEIFVDLASLHTAEMDAQTRHFLDDRFSTFLGEGEQEFKARLMDLVSDDTTLLSATAKDTAAYERIRKFLQDEMGLDSVNAVQKKEMEKSAKASWFHTFFFGSFPSNGRHL